MKTRLDECPNQHCQVVYLRTRLHLGIIPDEPNISDSHQRLSEQLNILYGSLLEDEQNEAPVTCCTTKDFFRSRLGSPFTLTKTVCRVAMSCYLSGLQFSLGALGPRDRGRPLGLATAAGLSVGRQLPSQPPLLLARGERRSVGQKRSRAQKGTRTESPRTGPCLQWSVSRCCSW